MYTSPPGSFYSLSLSGKDMDLHQHRRRQAFWAMLFMFGLIMMLGAFKSASSKASIVTVDPEVARVVDPKFLSLGLDTSFVNGMMKNLSLDDWKQLEELVAHLSPGYLRLGGNEADRAVFNNPSEENFVNISPNDLLTILNFAKKTKFSLLYDFNVLLRDGSNLDTTNAEKLLIFLKENHALSDFQLGNEPNNFPHRFNFTLTASQLAKDFVSLRSLLNSYDKSSLLIGPDVTRPIIKEVSLPSLPYLSEFLSTGVSNSLNAVSWHHYYLSGRDAQLKNFLDPYVLELLPLQISRVKNIVRKYSDLPIWLTETGSAYGGGAPNLSDTFASTFLFLDKLGISARMGISLVVRQSLLQGHYALIDRNIKPLPDFWIALAFKKLIGTQVYKVRLQNDDILLRFYAQGLKLKIQNELSLAGKPSWVVLYGMNLSQYTKSMQIGNKELYICHSFIFTSKDGDMQSKSVLLNGKELKWPDSFGAFNLSLISPREVISVPPFSLWFFILC